jgi:hypothetical protein
VLISNTFIIKRKSRTILKFGIFFLFFTAKKVTLFKTLALISILLYIQLFHIFPTITLQKKEIILINKPHRQKEIQDIRLYQESRFHTIEHYNTPSASTVETKG